MNSKHVKNGRPNHCHAGTHGIAVSPQARDGASEKNRTEREGTMKRKALVTILGLVCLALGFLMSCSSSSRSSPPPPLSHTTRYLVVPDYYNARVLIYNAAFSTGESASVVLGQSGFTTNVAGLTASGMAFPNSVAEDNDGNLYVSDSLNNRVLQFKPPFTNGMAASLVIGQPDFTTGTANTTQNGLSVPWCVAFDGSGNLWVADDGNSRILEYKPPFANGMNASVVLGQPNFTSNLPAGPPFPYPTTSSGLDGAEQIAFDASGDLWVTDGGNSRVLEFKPPFANGMTASLVIGQTDFVSNGGATTASAFEGPTGVAFDSAGNLWIGDEGNSRVLQFTPPFSTGMSASLVLGQPNFTSGNYGLAQNEVRSPFGIAFDSGGNLYVADYANDRTLQFTPPFSNNQNASLVLGKPDFTTGGEQTSATGQSQPTGATPAF